MCIRDRCRRDIKLGGNILFTWTECCIKARTSVDLVVNINVPGELYYCHREERGRVVCSNRGFYSSADTLLS